MVSGPKSLIFVSVVMLAMLALVTGGPRVFEKVLPEGAIAWLETMGGDGQMTSIEDSWGSSWIGHSSADKPEDPAAMLADTSEGWRAAGPIASTAGNGVVLIDTVLEDFSARVDGDAPARTETLTPLASCTPTPPSAGAAFLHAAAAASKRIPLGLATYDDADLGDAVLQFAAHLRETGKTERPTLGSLAFEVFDVSVTETARPVYLVLEAPSGQVIFNVHTAPGVRLERVVLLGGQHAGVANVASDIPVEVLRGPELLACGLLPFYPLNPNHLFHQSVANGVISGTELVTRKAEIDRQVAAWDTAFRAMFGVGSTESRSGGWDQGLVAHVGPLPSAPEGRAVWQPIDGSLVRLTLDQYVEYPGLAEEDADFAARVVAIATAFAGGDLALIKRGVEF